MCFGNNFSSFLSLSGLSAGFRRYSKVVVGHQVQMGIDGGGGGGGGDSPEEEQQRQKQLPLPRFR